MLIMVHGHIPYKCHMGINTIMVFFDAIKLILFAKQGKHKPLICFLR